MDNNRIYIRYNLQFFANSESGEKTEEPTSKKLGKAREEGQVAKSQDLNTAIMLLVLFFSIQFLGGYMYESFKEIFKFSTDKIPELAKEEFTLSISVSVLGYFFQKILLISLPILAFGLVGAIIVNLVQVKWKLTGKPLKPKLSSMNPINGAKKLFSKDKIFDLVKTIAKLGVLFYVVYDALNDEWGLITNIYELEFAPAVSLIVSTVLDLAVRISLVFFVLALADYIYQKRKFKQDMKMTKQEVKDEYKQTEGNPEIKGQIRRKMQEASRRRMMQRLPEADVVITNPTHLAVAVKYDKKENEAPVVIAKGADYLAQRIRDIAKETRIEIVENKPVARMLYHNVEIGEQIPPELYQTVAEILAYVYGLKGRL